MQRAGAGGGSGGPLKVRRNPAKVNGATGGQRAGAGVRDGAAAQRRAAATSNGGGGGAVIAVGAGDTRCGWMKGIYCTERKAEIGGSGAGGGGGVGS